MRAIIMGLAGILLGAFGVGLVLSDSKNEVDALADPVIPRLNAVQSEGEELFNDYCSSCHGENATGTEEGPPFLSPIYKPSHHADGAFYMAVMRGTRAHHWTFGDMPAQPHVTQEEIGPIVAYVRALQRANGIE